MCTGADLCDRTPRTERMPLIPPNAIEGSFEICPLHKALARIGISFFSLLPCPQSRHSVSHDRKMMLFAYYAAPNRRDLRWWLRVL